MKKPEQQKEEQHPKTFSDNERYWLERHNTYNGDIRSVGNLSKDVDTNIKGYESKNLLIKRIMHALFGQNFDNIAVLELGCGIGMLAQTFIDLGAMYTGVDVSETAILQAQVRCPQADFLCRSIVGFNSAKKFEVVFCADVLLHIIDDHNWRHVLQQMCALRKESGHVFILERIFNEPRNIHPHMVSRSFEEYDGALALYGNSIEQFRLDGVLCDRAFRICKK